MKAVWQPIQLPFAEQRHRQILLLSLSGTVESCVINVLIVKTSHSGLISSVYSGYEMLSDIKSFKRALRQVELVVRMNHKCTENHVSSASSLELTEGFVQFTKQYIFSVITIFPGL
jgi:hypothetical protein